MNLTTPELFGFKLELFIDHQMSWKCLKIGDFDLNLGGEIGLKISKILVLI